MFLPRLAMAHLPSLLPLFFFLQILHGVHASVSHGSPLQLDYSTSICSKSYMCGDVNISYPFHLSNETGYTDSSSYYCGYTDLNITCIQDGVNQKATIQLAGHEYTIQEIIYDKEAIVLADSDALRGGKCPRVSHNVSFDEGWLQYNSTENLTFLFGCNLTAADPWITTRDKNRIRCKVSSNSPGFSFVFTPGEFDESTMYELADHCAPPIVVPVDGNFLVELEKNRTMVLAEYGVVIEKGFELAWHMDKSYGCDLCEKSQGRCAYSQNKAFLGCLCSDGKMAVDSSNCPRSNFSSGGARTAGAGDSSLKRKHYIIAGTSSILLLCLLVFVCLFSLKKYRYERISNRKPRIESFLQRNGTLHPKRCTYAEVKKMTNSFAEKLGQGGFGAVYRGNLSDGRQVAVKMLKDSKGDGEEFMNEVASISRTSHVNIVNLLGFCLQGSKRALIYEYMPNGSLERYAFNKNSKGELSLAWEILFDIAIGIARGLEYLHRGCNTRIVHFDIKPHNILLDQDFCPKISDFGMAKLCDNRESIISIAGARGTVGYIAPEVFSKQFGAISSKSDVYSYGMMVLEMVGARERNIDANSESSSHYFPQWIYEHLNEYCISSSEINGETIELVRKMIVVGLWCIQVIPTNRPTMTRVVEMLEGSTIGLELPPKVLLCW